MTEERIAYTVKTSVFEGPLDVLLNLIEERKLFINEISLASIADDYIAHVRNLPQFKVGDVTGFLLVAATLVLIKSKSLLPNLKLTEEETGEIGDLERRLRLYQLIKDAGLFVKDTFGKRTILGRSEAFDIGPVFSPDQRVTSEFLLKSIQDVVSAIPKKEFLPEVTVKKVISIEEMISSLTERIQEGLRTSFSSFAGSRGGDTKEKKVYVIVSFLAMLELVRQGLVNAIQGETFSEIELEKQADEPHLPELNPIN